MICFLLLFKGLSFLVEIVVFEEFRAVSILGPCNDFIIHNVAVLVPWHHEVVICAAFALLGDSFLGYGRLIQQQGALALGLNSGELSVMLTDYLADMHTLDTLHFLRVVKQFIFPLPHAFGCHLFVVVKVCWAVLRRMIVASLTAFVSSRP
jgi:hypothetical protein